jgi:nitrate reductase NapAB chaperone NapD
MNLSGILITAAIDKVDQVAGRLASIDGVAVDRVDRATGRIVVLQEAADVDAEVAGFSRMRTLPHVLSADLICHYFGEQPLAEPRTESALASLAAPVAASAADQPQQFHQTARGTP